jgi:hypothetical protein
MGAITFFGRFVLFEFFVLQDSLASNKVYEV